MKHTHAYGRLANNWFTKQFSLTAYKPLCGASFTGERFYDDLSTDPQKITCGRCNKLVIELGERK